MATKPGVTLDNVTHKQPMRLASLLAVIGEPARLGMLTALFQAGELSVSDLVARLQMSQPSVSYHLALMRRANVIKSRRDGSFQRYSVCEPTRELLTQALRLAD